MAATAADDAFLYVPEDEVPAALALGARFIEGDARLVKPRPMPARVDPAAFDRWQTLEARYRWCLALIARLVGDFAPTDDLDHLLRKLGAGQAACDRIYLFVAAVDMDRARAVKGVSWDRRLGMCWAGPDADLRLVFEWLTPAARAVWEAERSLRKAVHLLVKDRAAKEAAGGASDGGVGDVAREGQPRHVKAPSRTTAD